MKRIIKTGLALLAALFVMNACDVKEEPYIKGADDEKAILSFVVDEVEGTIDESSKTVTLDFAEGTEVTNLVPTIKVSTYATIEPASGVAQDFTDPVLYTVTAYNGTTAQYMVTADVHNADNEKRILSFKVVEPACTGVINEAAKTVTLTFPEDTDVTQLVPEIEVSEGATIDPASGVAQDFTNPVSYTVTAQNGSTAVYTVTAIVETGEIVPTGKVVLVKDFTGSRCVHCPAAAEYAHNLQQQLGEEHIFIMAVHAGSLAQPVGQYPDFLTDEGTLWYGNNTSHPLFAVDHVALTEGNALYYEQLDTPVAEGIAEEQTFEIVITNAYDEASRQLSVSAQIVALTDIEGDFNVTVGLVEDNIIGWQITPTGINREYVFRNVFRGSLNGAEGESMANGSLTAGENFFVQKSTTLRSDFNEDECYVVVYVHDKTQNGRILQTTVKRVK
ncbi:MAG: DUF5018 domain-containing protein [Bacteroidales bacterium]|nr:DUF5018 domain-containing protein [Bacteroidales bacterium]